MPVDNGARLAKEFMVGLSDALDGASAPVPAVNPQLVAVPMPPPPPLHAVSYALDVPLQAPGPSTGTPPTQPCAGYNTPANVARAHPQSATGNPTQQAPTPAPRNGAHGAGHSAPQRGHRYAVPTPLPPRCSSLSLSPSTPTGPTPSPLLGTPLFPAQPGPAMLPLLPTLPRAPPPRGTLGRGMVYAPRIPRSAMPSWAVRPPAPAPSDTPFTVFVPPARLLPHQVLAQAMHPPLALPTQSTTRGRKIVPKPTRRAQPKPSAATQPMHVPVPLQPTPPAPSGSRESAPEHATLQRGRCKRAHPDAGHDPAPTPKRAATAESRSTLDPAESSVPVGYHIQSENNYISPQHSHALQSALLPPPLSQEPAAARSSAPTEDDDLTELIGDGPENAGRPTPTVSRAGAPTLAHGGLRLPLGRGVLVGQIGGQTASPPPPPASMPPLLTFPTGGSVRRVAVGKPALVKRADACGPAGPSLTARASGSRPSTSA
ncbi:hypothetical protein AURDEDRAFT_171753 [Auricularia subglabra TFB-10046 SS5]|nr:hypothetical protein AURDEDRAFT_171753 [Auricularia subglabra TFB-10046 SS5]